MGTILYDVEVIEPSIFGLTKPMTVFLELNNIKPESELVELSEPTEEPTAAIPVWYFGIFKSNY